MKKKAGYLHRVMTAGRTYYSIRKSVRGPGGRVSSRTILYLGALGEEEAQRFLDGYKVGKEPLTNDLHRAIMRRGEKKIVRYINKHQGPSEEAALRRKERKILLKMNERLLDISLGYTKENDAEVYAKYYKMLVALRVPRVATNGHLSEEDLAQAFKTVHRVNEEYLAATRALRHEREEWALGLNKGRRKRPEDDRKPTRDKPDL